MLNKFRIALETLQVVALVIIAYGFVEWNDRSAQDMTRAEYTRWVEESCFPKRADERAVAVLDGGHLRCTITGNNGYGRTPRIISAAVMERP